MSTIEHVESGLPVKTGDAHPLPVTGLSGSVIADNGVALPIDSLAHTFTSSGGLITTDEVSYLGDKYVQTLTYTNGVIETISEWVKE